LPTAIGVIIVVALVSLHKIPPYKAYILCYDLRQKLTLLNVLVCGLNRLLLQKKATGDAGGIDDTRVG